MKQQRLCYISRDYYDQASAGNKAKADTEDTLTEMGAINLGLQRTIKNSKIIAFFRNLVGIIRACFLIRKGDILFLQYPIKKYFSFICTIARIKGANTISLIHDIGSIRTHRLTPQQEVKRLSHSDYLIATNLMMREWLLKHGMQKPIGALGLWDYRAPHFNKYPDRTFNPQDIKIAYAGALHIKKNPFLIDLSRTLKDWNLVIYGNKKCLTGWEDNPHISYKGFIDSEKFIQSVNADFGLVWDGDSLSTCSGVFGDYLKWNTPHKVSLYLRAGLPIIIWEEAAVASILKEEGVCITIKSLEELTEKLKALTTSKYKQLKENARQLAKELNEGHFLHHALNNYHTENKISL